MVEHWFFFNVIGFIRTPSDFRMSYKLSDLTLFLFHHYNQSSEIGN